MTDLATIALAVDSRQVKKGSQDLDNLTKSAKSTANAIDKFGNELKQTDKDMGRFIDKTGRMREANGKFVKGLEKTNKELKSTSNSANVLRGALAGVSASLAVKQVIGYADAWTNAENSIRQVTKSTAELEDVTAKLRATAKESRAGFAATSDLYSKLKRSSDNLGLSQQELIDITETINKSFSASGATAIEAENAIRQLAQGLSAGALRGDEFNSVAEQAPGILRAISASTGVATGDLRAFAAEGKITAEVITTALQDQADVIDKEFNQSLKTFSQNWLEANDNAMAFIGGSAGVKTAVDALGGSLVFVSENLDTLATAAAIAGAAIAATAAIAGTMIIATRGLTVATIALNAAMALNPFVLAARLAGAALISIGAYMEITKEATSAIDDMSASLSGLNFNLKENSVVYAENGKIIGDANKKSVEFAISTAEAAIRSAKTQNEASKNTVDGYKLEIEAAQALLKARQALGYQSEADKKIISELSGEIGSLNAAVDFQKLSMKLSNDQIEKSHKNIETLKTKLKELNKAGISTTSGTKKLTKAQKEGVALIKEMRTPLEIYEDTLDRINELLKLGVIGEETKARAIKAATKDLEDATGVTKKNEDALKAIEDQQQKTFDSWSNNITDLITNTKDLDDILGDLARTLLQKAFVNPLLISVGIQPAGGTAGSLISGAGGASGGIDLSGIGSLFSGGGSGFGQMFGDFATSGFGSSIGLSTSMIDPMSLQSVNTLSGAGNFLQNGLDNFSIGGSFLGSTAANLLGLGEGGSGFGGTIGGLAGSFLPIPFGSAIGSFLGTALDGLFGGSNKPTEFSFTSQDDEERFEGRNAKTLSNEFGETLFKVFRGRSEDTKIVEAMTPVLQTISSLESSIASVLTSEQIAAAKVGVASADFSAEDPDEAINQFVGARLGAILDQLDPVFAELVDKTELVGVQSLQYAASLVQINEGIKQGGPLIDLFGGSIESTAKFLDQIKGENETIAQSYAGLIAVQNSYYQNFFSEEERAAKVTAAAQKELDKLNNTLGLTGAAALDTKQEFRSYIESLDGTTEAGRLAIEAALGYQGALLAVADASKQATNNLSAEVLKTKADVLNKQASDALDLAKASFDVVKNAVSLEKQVITNSIKELSNVISGATSARNTLRASNSVTSSIDRTAAQDLINRARSGENIESSQLTRALSVVSKPSKDLFSSFTDYQRDFFSTSISIADLKNTSMNALTAEEQELERLSEIEETAKAQLDALLGIDASVLGLNDALSAFAASLAASRTATAAASTASTASTGDTFRTFVDSISSEYRSNQETGGTGRLTNDEGLQIYNYAASNGISLDQVDDLLGFTGDQAKTFAEFNNLPVFANGGSHTGGLRLVGERGPELEMTGPSRIMNNSDLKSAISGKDNNSEHESKMNMILSKMQLIIDRIYRQQTQWTNDALNVRVVT